MNYEPLTTKYKPAFTLIELLVVITIIAILIATTTISYTNAQKKGRDYKRKQDLQSVKQALESYYQKNGQYPYSVGAGRIRCTITPFPILSWGATFTCPDATYLNPLPKDPTGTNQYYYYSWAPYLTYELYASLENTRDPDAFPNNTQLPDRCKATSTPPGLIDAGSTYNYCIINP